MVLVILLLNVPIRIRKIMNNMNLKIKRTSKMVEETKIFFSRKVSAPRKIVHHQMKMKTTTMIQIDYFLW